MSARKVLHLVNRQSADGPGLRNLELLSPAENLYRSGFWDIPLAEAEALVGGMLYLQRSKATPSAFGGRVTGVEEVERAEVAHARRVAFTLVSQKEGRGVRWRGAMHAMATSGGLLDADDA